MSECRFHSALVVGGLCYWHAKNAPNPTPEQEIFAGWRDPFVERPAYVAIHGRWHGVTPSDLQGLLPPDERVAPEIPEWLLPSPLADLQEAS